MKIKFSRDPKVKLISVEDFLSSHNYLCDIEKDDLWSEKKAPKKNRIYYKFTPTLLICIKYGFSIVNYGTDVKEKLEEIQVAYRDGKKEYDIFDDFLAFLTEKKKKFKENQIEKMIEKVKVAKTLLPAFAISSQPIKKEYETYLIDTGYKTQNETLKDRFLVFDVETNGTRTSNDDLLSLSIYDPTTGICYNRFFPLELQPLILTTFIHGITDKDLEQTVCMDQDELDWLINFFHIRERTLLSFSGGKGTFDYLFVSNYCKRHGLSGFDNLTFENIKNRLPTAPYGSEGQLSKDNLCRMFGIEGVKKKHSSLNDCLLEWKLFEKIGTNCYFFIGRHLYKYSPEYIIPCTYLLSCPESEYNPSEIVYSHILTHTQVQLLKNLQNNPMLSNRDQALLLGRSLKYLSKELHWLQKLGYIKKESQTKRKSSWILLRDISDKTTKYKFDGKTIFVI